MSLYFGLLTIFGHKFPKIGGASAKSSNKFELLLSAFAIFGFVQDRMRLGNGN